jgi:hypothetical protein
VIRVRVRGTRTGIRAGMTPARRTSTGSPTRTIGGIGARIRVNAAARAVIAAGAVIVGRAGGARVVVRAARVARIIGRAIGGGRDEVQGAQDQTGEGLSAQEVQASA